MNKLEYQRAEISYDEMQEMIEKSLQTRFRYFDYNNERWTVNRSDLAIENGKKFWIFRCFNSNKQFKDFKENDISFCDEKSLEELFD